MSAPRASQGWPAVGRWRVADSSCTTCYQDVWTPVEEEEEEGRSTQMLTEIICAIIETLAYKNE